MNMNTFKTEFKLQHFKSKGKIFCPGQAHLFAFYHKVHSSCRYLTFTIGLHFNLEEQRQFHRLMAVVSTKQNNFLLFQRKEFNCGLLEMRWSLL